MRKIIANVIATLACGLASSAVMFFVMLVATDRSMWPYLGNTFAILVPVVLLLSFASVLPIALFLQSAGRFTHRTMSLAGMAIGLIPALFVGWLSADFSSALLQLLAFSAGAGGIGGLTYYFVYRAMSPNNSFKPKPLRGSA